jgi:hypothetical protein
MHSNKSHNFVLPLYQWQENSEHSLIGVYTSRKLCPKTPELVQFFWPAWSAIAKWLRIFYCILKKKIGACNIPLERSWKYLSISILHDPKFLKFQSLCQNQKHTHNKCDKGKSGTRWQYDGHLPLFRRPAIIPTQLQVSPKPIAPFLWPSNDQPVDRSPRSTI